MSERTRQASGFSLRAMVGGGFAIVAVCLALALSFAVASIEQLGDRSERLLESGVDTTRLIEQLADRITEVERTARQYSVVGSPSLLQIYRDRRAALLETVAALEARSDVGALAPALADLQTRLEQLGESLTAGGVRTTDMEAFAAMNDIAGRARDIAQRRFDAELGNLQNDVIRVRTALTAVTVAVVTAALVTALAFARLVSRPIRQITASIDALGRADLDKPIEVSGPRDLKGIGISLDWLRRRIRDLEAQKSRFVRHMSHELKSPLANIRAGVDLLREEAAGDPDNEEITAIVERNAGRLQQQIDDLLRYAGWQEMSPPQQPVPVKLAELIGRSVEDQAFEARTRGIEVRTDLTAVTLTADESQLRAIVDNLIGNAIKYSPDGGVVYVRLSRLGDAARIEVEDQGPGIPAELRDQVFEPFFRGPAAGATAGTGVGLSLAMTAARANGGSIRILDSDRGARVEVSLPLAG